MKSGLLLSSVITIWIIGTIISVNMLLPDITKTVQSLQTISEESSLHTDTASVEELPTPKELITNYSPLGVLDSLGL